jgi:hypothetical protein
MSSTPHVAQLRARAVHLRHLSAVVGASRAMTVYRLAGPDTWIGPTPQSCSDALLAMRRQLQASQQTLDDAARCLERRADQLERQPPSVGLVS